MANGTYDKKEIELNKKLWDECCKREIDYSVVEMLLKEGADPLGTADANFPDDHIYGDLIGGSQDYNSEYLPKITELFLKYGMDINNPRIPYNSNNSINPLWEFTFCPNENSIIAMKMLLDKGINPNLANDFLYHSISDYLCIYDEDPNGELNDWYIWTFKTVMLIASYKEVLENNKYLQEVIDYSKNTFNMHNFRNWDNYYYEFDTSNCINQPKLYKSVVRIFESKSKKQVWQITMI